MTTRDNDTSPANWLGVPVTQWSAMFQMIGVPTAILIFMGWMLTLYVPPVVNGHVELLNTTRTTLEQIQETLQASTAATNEIVEVQRATKTFMIQVVDDHRLQGQHLDEIKDDIEDVKKAVAAPPPK